MLVLDTAQIDTSDRADAYQSAVSQNCTTSAATFEDRDALWARIHAYELGQAKVLTIDASGTLLRRTPKMARGMNDCPIALALPVRSLNRLTRDRDDRTFDRDDLMLVDLSAPYVYGWGGSGASYAFHVDLDVLDVPMDVIRTAMPNLAGSPIYALVRDHFGHVMTNVGRIVDSGAAVSVGAASIELMRALIVTAASDADRSRELMQRSLPDRVETYIRHHLRDPDLSPAKIAAANAISVRQLYRLYENRDLGLEATIIEQRLLSARAALAARDARDASISAIASACGFSNPSYFADRFRRRFGMTPRQWRDLHHSPVGAAG
ncbi:helix-turn-helix domain-containing protein [Microbacterium sp. NPDC057407]|uniref:helix-turn-helix domain-containing protein n=1 Tax=Microbacterium sp. NPDC057407 TaxID=3346120 RepID=UPI00366B3C1D